MVTEQQTKAAEQSRSTQMERGGRETGLRRHGYDPFFLNPRDFFSISPFSMFRRMNEEMERMFGDFGFGRGQGAGGLWSPAIEVTERDGKYIVCAELPGLKPEEVHVEMTDDALVLHGERKSEHDEKQGGIHRTERRYGQFYRTVPLPEGVKAEEVKAQFRDGVLEVTIPVAEQQSRRRQIPVENGRGKGQQG